MSEILSREEFGDDRAREDMSYQERICAERVFALEDTIDALAEALKVLGDWDPTALEVAYGDDQAPPLQTLRDKGWIE